MNKRHIILSIALLLTSLTASAQRFFNLTAEQVKIDSLLPVFTYAHSLGRHYADSVYEVTIAYPEFIPMTESDIRRYHAISSEPLPSMPVVSQTVSVDRKQGWLDISMVPLVERGGQMQKLVSFMLRIEARPVSNQHAPLRAATRPAATTTIYAEHSVLQSGRWVKISVPQSGFYQLTDELIRQAGFSSPARVKVYGYGGEWQPAVLTPDYLTQTDDLQEVPTTTVGGRRVFYANGPVSWSSQHERIRNPYATHGYYFLTESDAEPLTTSADELLSAHYPTGHDYNTLYEVDDYAWYQGGRNLYDAQLFTIGQPQKYTLSASGKSTTGQLTVVLSAYSTSGSSNATVQVNGQEVATMSVPKSGEYHAARLATANVQLDNLQAENTVTITQTSGGQMRLDYIVLHADEPKDAPDLSTASLPTPQYVYQIVNQDHHADTATDMVIIIPTSQKLLKQAERLKALHEERDQMRVRIVPADELYNEFSSGTPDANAYRRYLKMLYDRAQTDADMPRYLVLFGDGAWDNRMLSSNWNGYQTDDFLLCYESDNSYSHIDCYVSDDYFCLLDDGEGGDMLTSDKADVAVGRFPVRTDEEAATMIDKLIDYRANKYAGAWQNTICLMGDDGNQNSHMVDADAIAQMIEQTYPNYLVKRVMWDAYDRVASSAGASIPDATRLIKQQMQAGALIMNYSGHGSPYLISHEGVLKLADFRNATSPRLPLWVTASCDIMPFDGQQENFGEVALFNKKGGAIAFFGTTRTVYQQYNRLLNIAFTRFVLGQTDGQRNSIGEAVRLAKNSLINNIKGKPKDLTINKLQYTLLGDPALVLAGPTRDITIERINDEPVSNGQTAMLKAGTTATVTGYVCNAEGTPDDSFNGTATLTIRDAKQQITCKQGLRAEADKAFVFEDRPSTVFNGADSVRQGRFAFQFAVPKDISYADQTGKINVYAVNNEHTDVASGTNEQFTLGGSGALTTDSIGPSIYCYLNSSSFTNGDKVNPTPYFVAEITDEDGINATGSGIGHDLQLIIDGDLNKTYSLNDYFQYDFGSYSRGTVGFSIPELAYGEHRLLFRAWDILNNSSTAELTFNVVKGLRPIFFDVECTHNPATTATSFRIIHDRTGSPMDVILDVFDLSGRHLWQYAESGVPTDNAYTIDWDLSINSGQRLHTGIYLYRLRISSDGSTYASKAKKLIVLSNK